MTEFQYEEYLELLKTAVSIESGSTDRDGVDSMAEFMAGLYENAGLSVKKMRFDERGGNCVEVRNCPESEEIDLLLVGHMDTVFPKGTLDRRPFCTEGDTAYGPGVADMKSGLLSAYYVVRELLAEGTKLKICVFMNSDEEISSRYSNPYITELAKKSRLGLVFEPARDGGAMVSDRKGLARFDVEFSGKYAHAGVNPQDGASAIHEMAKWITALVPMNNYEAGTSVNVGVVSGGLGANTVAEQASCQIDLRFKEISEYDKIVKKLEELKAHPFIEGVSASVVRQGYRPPMNASQKAREFMAVVDRMGEKIGTGTKWVMTGGGSDGNFISHAGCPVLDAMGPEGAGAHGAGEILRLQTVEPRIRLVYESLREMEELGMFR